MFPPIENAVLKSNPQFASLRKQLTSSTLNSNGSTKILEGSKYKPIANEELRDVQLQHLEQQWIRMLLDRMQMNMSDLPDEAQDSVRIISSLLNTQVSEAERDLLEDDVDSFVEYVTFISDIISRDLTNVLVQLTRIAYASTSNKNPSSAMTASLPSYVSNLEASNTTKLSNLLQARLDLLAIILEILPTQSSILAATAQNLEQAKHGTLSGGIIARADHLSAVAEGMSLKLKIMKFQALQLVYNGDAISALENYVGHLRDTLSRLMQRERSLKDTLDDYESVGPEMRDIAARYGDVVEKVKTVKTDIRRLGGDAGDSL